MGVGFTPQESCALYGLLAESSADIILKTDRQGFVLHSSQGLDRLGMSPQWQLIGPHLLDLAAEAHRAALQAEFGATIAGRASGEWCEFRSAQPGRAPQWFELQLRALTDCSGNIYGSLGIMRSITERKELEQKLFAAKLTDALTGLTNRRAFIAMLRHLVERKDRGCLALFDIDYFKAINMRFGQAIGDRVLVVFSDLLRSLMRRDDIISRIGSESLAVLLPQTGPADAASICRRIIATLDELRTDAAGGLIITASAGVSRIAPTLDDTIKRAELALFLAKAKGRNRLEVDASDCLPWQ